MATFSYSAVVDHTSDAGFRAWGSGIDTGLAAAGLVQTADTGQINWVTVTRPAVNTVGGYTIWRLASSAMYFKLEYGTNNGATSPDIFITAGTGSNGSGTITGQTSTRASIGLGNVTPTSTAVAYTTFISVLSGTGTAEGLTLVWALNGFSSNSNAGALTEIHRSVDASGNVTTTGFKKVGHRGSTGTGHNSQDVRTAATAFTAAASNNFSLATGDPTSSLQNSGDSSVYLIWADYKDGMQPHIGSCGYVYSEWAEATTKSITLFGSTAHTYLAVGQASGTGPVNGNSATYGLAVIYE